VVRDGVCWEGWKDEADAMTLYRRQVPKQSGGKETSCRSCNLDTSVPSNAPQDAVR
jgi:hypothetical protein